MTGEFGSGHRLLVVDDEATVRDVLVELLGGVGFEITEAESVEAAERCCEAERFDLLLVDKNLPDGSGLEFAQAALDTDDDRAVLIMTGYASMESVVDALRLRVADYLTKPFGSLEEVIERVQRCLEGLQLRREHKRNLAALRQANAELESMAVRDPLTGLFNHAFFQEGLARELSRSERYLHPLSLLFIDVDNFKKVNDTRGHRAGDEVLRRIASILKGQSRDADYQFRLREHDIAARYGGDEFVLLLPETPKNGAAVTAERLRLSVEDADLGRGADVTLSIGVAAYPDDGLNRDSLVEAADAALYAAKHSGRNRVITYTTNLVNAQAVTAWDDQADVQELAAVQRLIAFGQLPYVYQPIAAAKGGRVVGYEALCRPEDPILSSVSSLLDVATRAGKTTELGRLMREQAGAPLERLAPELSLYLNLHPLELFDPRLREGEPPLEPWAPRVVFEVTRTASVTDLPRLGRTLAALRARGYRVALEDVPDGYPGIELLATLEPEYLKLEVAELHRAKQNQRSLRALRHRMDFCAGEGIQVIAERVETEADRDLAVELGCGLLQGRLLGPEGPLPSGG